MFTLLSGFKLHWQSILTFSQLRLGSVMLCYVKCCEFSLTFPRIKCIVKEKQKYCLASLSFFLFSLGQEKYFSSSSFWDLYLSNKKLLLTTFLWLHVGEILLYFIKSWIVLNFERIELSFVVLQYKNYHCMQFMRFFFKKTLNLWIYCVENFFVI